VNQSTQHLPASDPAATQRPMVDVRGVSKRFTINLGKELQQVQALHDISFTAQPGEIVALAGLSGCGKTTLLRILMGLDRADAGSIRIAGREVDGPGHDRGMVFQHAELLPWRTALKNVEYGLHLKGTNKEEARTRALEVLRLVGLDDSAGRRPHQLSGGMRQRVGIARALAIDPEVLLMDEPFGALDAQTRETLQGELLAIHARTGKTIVFVTHDLDEAVLLADKVLVMGSNPGHIRAEVPIDIPRPRNDPEALRATPAFMEHRYKVWKLLQTPTSSTL
jgi:NitT/TauT family transport system ATP-binding protein